MNIKVDNMKYLRGTEALMVEVTILSLHNYTELIA